MGRRTIILGLLTAGLLSVAAAADDKPEPRLKLILVERFRFEAWDNAVSLDDAAADATAYTRNRTTLGLSWRPAENVEVLGKVTNEFRVYLAPKDRAFNWHELFVDNLYVKWTLPGRVPFTVTAGRQDINLGEGFVIADSTPLDGSRSYYFNALRLDVAVAPGHKIIAFVHAQETRDKYLPVVHGRDQALVEQPDRALAVYYSGAFGKAKVDAYAVRKMTEEAGTWLAGRVDTLGARAQVPFSKPLVLTAEGAFQGGRHGDAGRSAFGGIAHLDWTPAWRVPFIKTFVLGGIYLSGDDPATARMEGWDPVYSRWPKWSEGYIYTFNRESRPAYWSNLNSVYGSLILDLGARANATVTFHRLGADRTVAAEFPGGTGLRRGGLVVGRLNFTISKLLSGHFQWDHFEPRDFYAPEADAFNWLRFELIFRY